MIHIRASTHICEVATRSPDVTAAAKRLLHAAYASDDDGRRLHVETALQRRLLGGWNMLASAARGLGAPPVLTPGFLSRGAQWSEEADAEAEAELRAMLGDAGGDVRLNKSASEHQP